jgi:hypothetical protein
VDLAVGKEVLMKNIDSDGKGEGGMSLLVVGALENIAQLISGIIVG